MRTSALTINALEVADKEHAEVHSWSNPWLAALLVEGCTLLLDEGVKAGGCQNLVEFVIERVGGALGDAAGAR